MRTKQILSFRMLLVRILRHFRRLNCVNISLNDGNLNTNLCKKKILKFLNFFEKKLFLSY